MTGYQEFIGKKTPVAPDAGLSIPREELASWLKDFQAPCVEWALRKGRAALFQDCGLGKTPEQLEWARHVSRKTGKPVLILAPLAVSRQTAREGDKFGIEVRVCRSMADMTTGVNIANYEIAGSFDPVALGGIVLDESSILKNYVGKTKRLLVSRFAGVPMRLCCTATPAPNDTVELGNHAEFLGVMDPGDMLTRWFINDTRQANTLRLKKHAEAGFWRWVSTWAVSMSSPSDLGFSDDGYALPPLVSTAHVVGRYDEGLAPTEAPGAAELHRELAVTVKERCGRAAEIASLEPDRPWVLWVSRNDEADTLAGMIPGAEEVRGCMPTERKERILEEFTDGNIPVLVTKPSIAGWGLNWQHCDRTGFVSPSYSFEMRYQAIRRFWRFGQAREVHVHDFMGPKEALVFQAQQRKEAAHATMAARMRGHMLRLASRPGALGLDGYAPSVPIALPRFLQEVA